MKSVFLSGNGVSKATHYLETMLTYHEIRISDTVGWPQDVLQRFDHALCSVHAHEHETN